MTTLKPERTAKKHPFSYHPDNIFQKKKRVKKREGVGVRKRERAKSEKRRIVDTPDAKKTI